MYIDVFYVRTPINTYLSKLKLRFINIGWQSKNIKSRIQIQIFHGFWYLLFSWLALKAKKIKFAHILCDTREYTSHINTKQGSSFTHVLILLFLPPSLDYCTYLLNKALLISHVNMHLHVAEIVMKHQLSYRPPTE